MIEHKSFHIIGQSKRREEKIKLRWLWNSVYFIFWATIAVLHGEYNPHTLIIVK